MGKKTKFQIFNVSLFFLYFVHNSTFYRFSLTKRFLLIQIEIFILFQSYIKKNSCLFEPKL